MAVALFSARWLKANLRRSATLDDVDSAFFTPRTELAYNSPLDVGCGLLSEGYGAAAGWWRRGLSPGDGCRFRCRQVALARFMLQDLLTIRADRDRFVSYVLIFI